mgnify:CR=1 FL=1
MDLQSIFLAKIRELDPSVGEIVLDCGNRTGLHIFWDDGHWKYRVVELEKLSKETMKVAKKIQKERIDGREVAQKIMNWFSKQL